ncbi:hypothetical protein I552_7155 [Mycobacterium xenopi 3993]|nr:hypothetical protein I552_7155 [Mycobacterium xenopi 3993]
MAHGPSTGCAIGANGTPNRHMAASGNTTSVAPASAAGRCTRAPAGGSPPDRCR